VLEGRVGAQIGDEVIEAGPGEVIRKPRGIPHAFWNAGDAPARLIEMVSPAGFEAYFAEMAPILNVDGPPDVEALGAVQARYGLSMDHTSIGRLAAEHGLAVA
jgi:Cupin domain